MQMLHKANEYISRSLSYETHTSFILAFTTASILGNYARVGLNTLTDYSPSYVASGSILWSNLTSCFIMGMLQVLKKGGWFEPADMNHIFVVLATGFCGSFSSYSSMMMEMFLYSTSLTPADISKSLKLPNRAYGIMEFLSVLLVQLFVSIGSYIFGRSVAKNFLLPFGPESYQSQDKNELEPESPVPIGESYWGWETLKWVQWTLSVMAIPLVALIIVLTCVYNNNSRSKWTLPQLFAIPGSFLRYYLALWLNQNIKSFPLGTFFANELAVLTMAVFTMCARGKSGYGSSIPIASSLTQCRVVSALSSGFCGSLSTISTFINEGYNLPLAHALIYYAISISTSYILEVILLGSMAWTRGLTIPVC